MLSPALLAKLDLQPAASQAQAPQALQLANFGVVDQVQDNWCWAAVSVMVFNYYSGRLLAPCDWATICIGDPNVPHQCCNAPGVCDRPLGIDVALRGMLARNLDGTPLIERPLPASGIVAEIGAKGRPIVCVQVANAHVVVIYGIDQSAPGGTNVIWADPAGGFSNSTEIGAFTNGGAGWSWTFFTQPGGP